MRKFIFAFLLICGPLCGLHAQLQLYAPLNDSTDAPTGIELQWIHLSQGLNYKIEIDTTSNFNTVRCRKIIYSGNVAQLTNGTITAEFVSNLKHNTKYYWRVQMMTAVDTTYTPVWNFSTTNQVKILYPQNNAVGVPLNSNFSFYSRFATPSYRYQVSTSTIFTNPLYDNYTASYAPYGIDMYLESFTLPADLNSISTYYWRMQEVNDSSVSAWSPTYKFTTSDKKIGSSAAEELSVENEFIYPNPATDRINFKLDFIVNEIVFYDSKGAVLQRKNCNAYEGSIDTSMLPRGYFIVVFKSVDEIQRIKSVVLID